MAANPDTGMGVLFSVQASYVIHPESSGVAICDETIKIPLIETVQRQVVINNGSYYVIPVVEITPSVPMTVKFITNEGITVEPLHIPRDYSYLPYDRPSLYFVLPRGTTGIKRVVIDSEYSIRAALEFDTMPPPYNYENALFGVFSLKLESLQNKIDSLGAPKIVTASTSDIDDYFYTPGLGVNDKILGWSVMFSTAGNTLTLTSGNASAAQSVFSGVDVSGKTYLNLTYDRMSYVLSLYSITRASDGRYENQKLLASGVVPDTLSTQPLHLIIDGEEYDPKTQLNGDITVIEV